MQLLVCECHAVQGHSGIPLSVLRDDHRMLASFRFRVEPNSPPAPDLLVRVLRKSRNTVCVFSVNHMQVDYAPIAPERLSVPLLLFQSVLHQERGHHRFFQSNSRFHGFSVSWIESGVGSLDAQNGGSFAVHAQCVFLVERSQLLRDHPQSRLAEIWSQETHSYDPFPVNLNSLFLKQELNSRCYDALLNLAGNV